MFHKSEKMMTLISKRTFEDINEKPEFRFLSEKCRLCKRIQ